MQKEFAKKVEQIAEKARKEFNVPLAGFKVTFTNRGKNRVVSYRSENGHIVARVNAKWLTDENKNMLFSNLAPHIVAIRTANEANLFAPSVAKKLGAPDSRPMGGLKTPGTCKRVAKTRNWLYIDSKGNERLVSTRLHNRMHRERVTYTYKNNGATIDFSRFVRKV